MHKIFAMLVAGSTAFLPAAPAQAVEWKSGVHYFELLEKQPVQTGQKIEVTEAFWYMCPHCAEIEPYVEKWLKSGKPANAEFVRMPAVLRDTWAFHARTYYAFEALGIVDKAHVPLFKDIHDRKIRIGTPQEMAKFAAQFGVKEQDFLDAFRSFSVDAKLRWATRLSEAYELDGVPSIIVDGRYRSSAQTAGGYSELFELVNFLVAKAAADRRAPTAAPPPRPAAPAQPGAAR
jgi:thiol:disulfide interchange protein DsbA